MHKDKENQPKKRVEISDETDLNGDRNLLRLEAGLRKFADFRFNTITRFPEVKFQSSNTWKRIDDFTLNSIVRHLKSTGLSFASKSKVGDLLESDFSKQVNPIKEYFEHLPPFTGDPIGKLCSTVELATDPLSKLERSKMFRKFMEKWLIGAVANVFVEERCANQLCLIIAGPQGAFKSTWIKNLCPPALEPYYVEGALDPDNKDSMLATATNFIYNLDDYFAGITSKKINEFKGLLTKNKIKVRRSYARYAEELPKICSFIASSNEAQFLHDPTGNRRFIPFEVERIDIKKAQSFNIDQVWAQAYSKFKEGAIYWLDKNDQVELSEYNERFEVQSNEYEILVTYLRPASANNTPEADLTNAEILTHLQDKVSLKLSAKKLGEALRKANFPRYQKQRNGRRSWVYGIIYADDADIHLGRQPTDTSENEQPKGS